ncbi:MAG TPA: transcriptional repressor LexA [Clostridiaceae bacterium]|nr:transcriptional repressor LexA [Clostridiaceae bacterium]
MASQPKKPSKRDLRIERVFTYICEYINKRGYAPSVRDICNGCDIGSTSTVHGYLKDLEKQERIRYASGKRRAIQLVETNEQISSNEEASDDTIIQYPVLGTVTAGVPIFAEEQTERMLKLSDDLFPSRENVFILRVKGDSMIDAAILDGDLAVVEQTPTAPLNSIIVGLIEDEATVKRLVRIDGKIYLQPENEAYDLIPFNREECKILGRVIGVVRTEI